MIDMSEVEARKYSLDELSTILKDAGVKPNSYKEVKVIIELVPNGWLHGITGYSKRTEIFQAVVKGWATESGSGYLKDLCSYSLKILVLKTPIIAMKLYEEWRR